MTYLRCDECGFTVFRGASLSSSCPRCRLRGSRVALMEVSRALSYARTEPGQGDALVSERGRAAPD
jgi:predicted Zn-ribbon and HTH transcriptional regulator